MTRSFHKRFLNTSLLAFAISLIVIPAASAMPVLSDSTKTAPTAKSPALVSGPMDGYIARTADGTVPSPVAVSDQQPLTDSWYTPGVLGSTQSFSVGRTTPDVPPVGGRAIPVLSSPSGFDWNNAGLGVAFGAALIALMAFGAHRARRARTVPILH